MTRKSEARRGKWSIAGAVVVAVGLVGCGDPVKPGSGRGSGSVALSQDSALVYAADTDNGVLAVVDAKTAQVVAKVPVGSQPARVAVGSDDTVYVANRGSRSVSVIRKGDWSVAGELATDVDPVGLAVEPDGKTVYVTCATASDSSDYGTLIAFDTTSFQRNWTLQLTDEPRAIALLGDGKAAVALYRAGDVVTVDLKQGKLLQNKTALYSNLNASALSLQGNGTPAASAVTFHPRAMTDLVATPDGTRLFATTLLSREAPILTPPTPATPYYESQGPRLAGSVVTPAVVAFDVNGAVISPKVDDVGGYGGYSYGSSGQTSTPDYPQTSFATTGGYVGGPDETLVQGPSAAVVDQLGQWMYVVNRDSQNVMLVPVSSRQAITSQSSSSSVSSYNPETYELPSVYAHADVGAGADGVAVAGDNKSFWVYSQFDHALQQFALDSSKTGLIEQNRVKVADDRLGPTLSEGRKEFYDANDRRISARSAAISCGSCHLEGRDDAHVWSFPDGPRQTPALAGRGLLETQPYHWSGEFPTLAGVPQPHGERAHGRHRGGSAARPTRSISTWRRSRRRRTRT